MSPRIGIVGVGWSGFHPTTAGRSYKEMMFEAASAAYLDASLDPRTDVDSFVCASEDIEEGTSIFDEYVPDQLGAVQRPVHTVAADGLFALATATMVIRSGVAGVVAVEAHAKASDVLTPGRVDAFALDPVLTRPLGVSAIAIAGLEMRSYLHASGRSAEECADVAARNREHARSNHRASYADAPPDPSPLFDPLLRDQAARSVDGCVVVVLASGVFVLLKGVLVDHVLAPNFPITRFITWGDVWLSSAAVFLIGVALAAIASFLTLLKYLRV